MEKIVIFIIIMIVSSYFSKKKKKQATLTSKKSDTTFFDTKGNKVSESRHRSVAKPTVNSTQQPQSISDALSELKSIFTNTPKPKPVPEPEVVYETNYGEVSTEANDSEYSEKDYREEQIKYETQRSASRSKYKSQSVQEENTSGFKPMDTNSYAIKIKKEVYRKDIMAGLFNTKNQLKKAVIINEIFNKKY